MSQPELRAQIRALIERDRLGSGAVSASTVTELALLLRPAADPADTLAERRASVKLLRELARRWTSEAAVPHIEVVRLSELINGIDAGLHR